MKASLVCKSEALAMLILLAVGPTVLATSISSTATGGVWNLTTTWVGGVVPTNSDDVTIVSGATVTLAHASQSANSITIDGVLNFPAGGAGLITVQGMTVDSGGSFSCNTNALSSLTVGGDITNSGIFTGGSAMSTTVSGSITNNGTFNGNGLNPTGVAISGNVTNNNSFTADRLTFTGSGNATFGGSGGTTSVTELRVNKGTDATSILELTASNFSTPSNAGFLTLQKGNVQNRG